MYNVLIGICQNLFDLYNLIVKTFISFNHNDNINSSKIDINTNNNNNNINYNSDENNLDYYYISEGLT